MELHKALRAVRRPLLKLRYEDGSLVQWEKAWLTDLAERMWNLSPRTARILAGEVEMQILPQDPTILTREDILDVLNERVAQLGLADAVPVRMPYQQA